MTTLQTTAALGVVGGISVAWLVIRRDVFLRIASHHHAQSSRPDGRQEDRRRHRALREKYQRAASRPWLPVAPDPPGRG